MKKRQLLQRERKKTSIERNKPTTNNNKNTEIYNMTTVAPEGHKNIQKNTSTGNLKKHKIMQNSNNEKQKNDKEIFFLVCYPEHCSSYL